MVGVNGKRACPRWLIVAAVAATIANTVQAGTITWDGGSGGSGTSWNLPANWDASDAALPDDVAKFTNAGITSGKVISLDASQAIDTLYLSLTTGFTVGAASDATNGYVLSLRNVTREDVSGTESNHTIAAPLSLTDASTWNIAGSNSLTVFQAITSNGNAIEKTGAGSVIVGGSGGSDPNVGFTGAITVTEGSFTLRRNGNNAGNVTVGGGANTASFALGSVNDQIANTSTVRVKNKGTFSSSNNEGIFKLIIEQGGSAGVGFMFLGNGGIELTGGTVSSGNAYLTGSSPVAVLNTAAVTSTLGASSRLSGTVIYNVANGGGHWDLNVTGLIQNNSSSSTGTFTKNGDGVMVLSAASGSLYGTATSSTTINAGTLLANNTSGSATAARPVQVNAGATLGGTGIIGGRYTDETANDAAANVTLTGTSTSALATLAPGSIDNTTGAHLTESLTVGSASQANSVTFGNFSRLLIQFGVNGAFTNDVLEVFGTLNLNSTSDRIELVIPNTFVLNQSEYTLATFTSLATAGTTFNTEIGVPENYEIQYGANAIKLVAIPEPVSLGLLGIGVMTMLGRSRRLRTGGPYAS